MKRLLRLLAVLFAALMLMSISMPVLAATQPSTVYATGNDPGKEQTITVKKNDPDTKEREKPKTEPAKKTPCSHRWDNGKTLRHPSCTARGLKQFTCKLCGATKKGEFGAPWGHDWDEWTEWEVLDEKMVRSHTCKRCGLTEEETQAYSPVPLGGGDDKPNLVLDLGIVNEPAPFGKKTDIYIECEYAIHNFSSESIHVNGYNISKPDGTDTSGQDLAGKDVLLGPGWTVFGTLHIWVGTDDPVARNYTVYGVTDPGNEPVTSNTVSIYKELADPTDSLYLEITSLVAPNGFYEGKTIHAGLTLTNKGTRQIMITMTSIKDIDKATSGLDSFGAAKGTLEAGETIPMTADVILTKQDIQSGQARRALQVGGTPPEDPSVSVYSNKQYIKDSPEEPVPSAEGGLKMSMKVTNLPAQGFFEPGDTINYLIAVTNMYDETCHNLVMKDNYAPGTGVIDTHASLAPAASYFVPFSLKAADAKIINNTVLNSANVTGTTDSGANAFAACDALASVSSTMKGPDAPEEPAGLSIVKTIANKPENGSFYLVGEPIQYTITVTNTGAEPINALNLYDDLAEGGLIATYAQLAPGGACSHPFTYVPNENDLAAGFVVNRAHVSGVSEGGKPIAAYSEPVRAEIGETIAQVDPGNDLCAVSLIVCEEDTLAYTVAHCAEHTAVAAQAQALTEQAGEDGEARRQAYEAAAALWKESVDALYDKILSAASTETARAAVQKDRTAFYAMLEASGALFAGEQADVPEAAAMRKTALLREKCAELCWYVHSRPGALPDSRLNQAAPLNGEERCLMDLKTDRPELLVYALNFCPEHAPAAAELHAALLSALEGAGAKSALNEARAQWETLAADAEKKLTGAYAAAEQTAWAAYREAHVPFIRLFGSTDICCEEALAKMALARTLTLCPLEETQGSELQGGVAPVFTDLF